MFLPMRPMEGERLTAQNILAVTRMYRERGYLLQRKLNGDRGVLESRPDGLMLWNRYGSEYSASAVDLADWNVLPVGTILDGEVWRGEFYPFESIGPQDQAARIALAQHWCAFCSNPYVFGGVTDDWLMGEVTLNADPLTRQWEGVVAKFASAKYVPLKKPHHESQAWVKLRWC